MRFEIATVSHHPTEPKPTQYTDTFIVEADDAVSACEFHAHSHYITFVRMWPMPPNRLQAWTPQHTRFTFTATPVDGGAG